MRVHPCSSVSRRSATSGVTRSRMATKCSVVGGLAGDDAVLRVPEIVLDLARRYTVREVAYDPWRFQSEALRLGQEHGLVMVQLPQSHARMTVASEKLHAAIVERRLRHRGWQALDEAVASAVAKRTGRGWRIDKATRDARVDAVVALAMCVDRAAQPAAEAPRLLGWV
jgi:phage terminase large subunit-like protein